MKIIITRPEEDAGPLAEKLKHMGHEAIVIPVLDIVPRMGIQIPNRHYQAACLTSANGVRCLRDVSTILELPIIAVGPQSQKAALQKGFTHVAMRGGDVNGLVAYVTQNLNNHSGPLLYISGSLTSGDLEGQLRRAGFDVDRIITYDALSASLDDKKHLIAAADGVMLYSPRSAQYWHTEIMAHNLSEIAGHLKHFCLSANVAAALPQSWDKRIAKVPTESAMLELLD
jgi:uroporphyrinogen-III synthase